MALIKRAAVGLAGATLMAGGLAGVAGNVPVVHAEDGASDALPKNILNVVRQSDLGAQRVDAAGDFSPVSNVTGTFAFTQDGVTPNDELFNIFGSTLNSACATVAADASGRGTAAYFINVGGDVRQGATIDLNEMRDEGKTALMGCSCATGAAFGQAAVVGVPLEKVVELVGPEEGANVVTAYGADGFGQALPLSYALEKKALLVYQVNGEDLVSEAPSAAQLWMPETVARYFTRDVCEIEFSHADEEPGVMEADALYRAKVNMVNHAGASFSRGSEVTFSGTADDCGSAIAAIEFSMDDGATWTSCPTDGATADRWVNWNFTVPFEKAGHYKLNVRAVTQDGTVSPLASVLYFDVE